MKSNNFSMKKNLLLILTAAVIGLSSCSSSSPEKALEEFYQYKGKEETVMDPLILSGGNVVPLVLEKVKNKQMPKRRYAIGFLGNGNYVESLPILKELVSNDSEEALIRGDSLLAIYQIDQSIGREMAIKFKDDSSFLGKIAKDIIAGNAAIAKRSYLEALLDDHSAK